MTDEQLLTLLRAIRDLAMIPYPYPADSNNDAALCFALGHIAGIASKATTAARLGLPPHAPWRLVLNEEAFRELVAGKVVKLMTTTNTPIELILSDIGWERMFSAIRDADDDAAAAAAPAR
jgi:hypothetical protein